MKSTPLVLLLLAACGSGGTSAPPPVSAVSTSSADLPSPIESAALQTAPPPVTPRLATASPLASGEPSAHERSAITEFPERQSVEALDWLVGISAVQVDHAPRQDVLTLPTDQLFEPGETSLKDTAPFQLDALARALKMQAGREIVVRGHTDSLGDRSESKGLSLRRAEALRDYFVTKGLAPEHIRAEGAGSDRPIADNASPFGRAKNRRLEVIIEHRASNRPLARRASDPVAGEVTRAGMRSGG